MKKFITLSTLVVLLLFNFSACKKSNTKKEQTTLEKIQGKWQLDSDIQNHHTGGQDNIDIITGDPSDNVDFRTDGNVYADIGGFKDTSTYTLTGDTKIVLDAQVFDIITLTSNSFIVHNKQTTGPSDFDEVTITLKK